MHYLALMENWVGLDLTPNNHSQSAIFIIFSHSNSYPAYLKWGKLEKHKQAGSTPKLVLPRLQTVPMHCTCRLRLCRFCLACRSILSKRGPTSTQLQILWPLLVLLGIKISIKWHQMASNISSIMNHKL